MKTIHFLVALSALAPLLAGAQTWRNIQIVDQIDEDKCRIVAQKTCGTRRGNFVPICHEWHQINADTYDATHVVPTSQQERGSFLFFGSSSVMEANYYDCKSQPPRAKASVSDKPVAAGTGFFVTDKCHIVTNSHVVEDKSEFILLTEANESFELKLLADDPANDLAVLQGDCSSKALAVAGSTKSLKGHSVYTLGYPLIEIQGSEQKVSFGNINADSGIAGDIRFFQIDIPIQPGNSGGPLMNEKGEVIGVVTSGLNQLVVLEHTGSLPQNVNYAVKVDYLRPLLDYSGITTLIEVGAESNASPVQKIQEAEKSVGLILTR